MNKMLLCVVLLAVLLGGCSGVMMNAQYSDLLDRTSALSAESARRAVEGQMATDEMVQALVAQSAVWQKFRDARDGKDGK